jgi:tripartite-type tricarboxylate transporter receptor subunit TctC
MFRTPLTLLGALAIALAAALPAAAQERYPSRQIRIVVGFAAGGPTDVIARVLATDMTATLGQSVFVENKAGASAMIATREVKAAAPDGYTLLFASLGLNVSPILVGASAGYNPATDFAPVSLAATLPLLAVNAADSPLKTMGELIAKAKSKPEAVTYGSSGNGGSGHLAAELLGTMAKAKMLHAPFKGNGPALVEVMAGRVDFMFYPVIGIADQVEARRLKILAAGTAKRLPQFPDVPTMSEVGFPGFEETAPWVGMLAPAKTPPAVVQRLNEAVVKAIANPEVRARMEKLGAVVVGDSPAQFAAFLKRDYTRWEEVIKAAGVKGE